MKKIAQIIVFIAIAQGAGIIGSLFTVGSVDTWFATLSKPEVNPPSWIFGPVWASLYTLMGIAAFLVWQKGWHRKNVKMALGVFGIQLFLNAVWSVIFFGMQNPGWALADIALLWLAIVWTIAVFYRISKPAAYLLVPYLLWVSFAAYLNYAIWTLN
jgi:translocator protein